MLTLITVLKPQTITDVLSSNTGDILLLLETYGRGTGSEVLAGTILVNVFSNITAFSPDGSFRFWSAETMRSETTIARKFKVRKLVEGESVTLFVGKNKPETGFTGGNS